MQTNRTNLALNSYGHEALHSQALGASPHRLIQMLMEGVLTKIAYAKGEVGRKDFSGKSKNISMAVSIINGLRASLDKERGGEIATNLEDLYEYMNRCLIDANRHNDISKLDEVIALMSEIKSGWDQIPDRYRHGFQEG